MTQRGERGRLIDLLNDSDKSTSFYLDKNICAASYRTMVYDPATYR